jgi:hypothetical protein
VTCESFYDGQRDNVGGNSSLEHRARLPPAMLSVERGVGVGALVLVFVFVRFCGDDR